MRSQHKSNKAGALFQEHDMNAERGQTQLITCIESTMTMSELYSTPPIGMYRRLDNAWYKCSLIVKEANTPIGGGLPGLGSWSMNQLVFRVDFIGGDGAVDPQMSDKWVTGSTMKDMITPRGRGQKPKPKFAYDHTSLTGPSIRNSASQFRMTLNL